jgi:hypothetical protein
MKIIKSSWAISHINVESKTNITETRVNPDDGDKS